MNEAETRAELIDPALRAAGWGVVADSRVRRETICPGRIEGAGRRGKREIADYVLTFRNHKLAVIEAKARDKGDTEGVGQAKAYADKLQARFAFSTNGRRIYRIDMETGAESYVERYPTPDELWAEVFKAPNEWRDRFAAVPFEEQGGQWQTRYYQHNAIRECAGSDRRRQAAHPADARNRHRQDRDRLSDRLGAVPEPLESVAQAGAAAAHPVPRRPQHPGRSGLQRLLGISAKTRWRASSRMKSARKAACRRTPASSSRSSRPS